MKSADGTGYRLAGIPPKIADTVQAFAGSVGNAFPDSRIVLFGSYAKNTFTDESDIDIAVFLPSKCGNDTLVSAFRVLYQISGTFDCDIQPQVFFMDEVENPAGIVAEIMESGIDISVFSMRK